MQDFSCPGLLLQLESSPALHLPTSPLLRFLHEDTNSALSKFVEDQTVHGFLTVPGRRHQRYYRTSSSSFPGPFTVLPGLASITLKRVSESRKRSVPVSLIGLLFGNYALECVRGHLMAGLVALHVWGFPRASKRRSSWQLQAVDALWIEGPGDPG